MPCQESCTKGEKTYSTIAPKFRHGVIVTCNYYKYSIVIDGTEHNAIVIESNVIVIELLLFYCN